jgi:hypothetical protein
MGGKVMRRENTKKERRWWAKDIKMDLRELFWGVMD